MRHGARCALKPAPGVPYITRRVPVYDVLGEEGLGLIEDNAETILEEIGIDFREDAEALALWREAGAEVSGERVRFPRGMCRALIRDNAPATFTQHARNPARSREDRRAAHRVRTRLRPALRTQPRRGAALRDDRGPSATS